MEEEKDDRAFKQMNFTFLGFAVFAISIKRIYIL